MSEALQLINSQKEVFARVCSDPSIEFEREASFAMQVLSGSDYLMGVALRNKASLQAAITNVAAIGISLNPASKQAYLVPRDGKVCLDISYMGIMHLAQQTGAISWGQAVVVKANDTFELNGIDQPPIHKFNPFGSDRGEIIGVYVVVKTDTNDYLTHAMPIAKINDIRDRSSAWKAYKAKGTQCPWVTDYEEMAKKTCVKQAAKYWPRRERLDSAIHHVNIEGEEGLADLQEKDITPTSSPVPVVSSPGPTAGYMETLDTDRQTVLRDIAMDVLALMGNVAEAYEFMQEQMELNNVEDNEEKIALWTLFDSRTRSAIKKHISSLKEAA